MNSYNPAWNPHYDFSNPQNLAEIEKRQKFSRAFHLVNDGKEAPDSDVYKQAAAFLLECERKELGGKDGYDFGVIVKKDWGSNEVLSFKHENGTDICVKKIIVKPNNMLSLQSHEGRKEEWLVTDGVLSLIADGKLYEVSDEGVFEITAGRNEINDPAFVKREEGHRSIILPEGSIHCMINTSDAPVTVIETQTGITREADNNRFIDQIRNQKEGRATIPLASELHYQSAQLYWSVEAQIADKVRSNDPDWKVSYTPVNAAR